jgi:hypothetical protein
MTLHHSERGFQTLFEIRRISGPSVCIDLNPFAFFC